MNPQARFCLSALSAFVPSLPPAANLVANSITLLLPLMFSTTTTPLHHTVCVIFIVIFIAILNLNPCPYWLRCV